MRIGINAHLLAFTANYRQAGLSRYIYEMTLRLPAVMKEDNFVAYVGNGKIPGQFLDSAPPNLLLSQSRLPTIRAPIRIAWEQTALPTAALTSRLALLLCPVNVRPFILTCPAVITVHDLIFLHFPAAFHPLKRFYLRYMTAWSAHHASHIIAVSEATRRDIIRMLKVPSSRVTTVHNGVGPQFRKVSEEERAAFRREKDLAGRHILYLGTLEPRKNIARIINAFASIASDQNFSDVSLLIGGSKGWYYDEIYAAAEQQGLLAGKRVQFLGRVPDGELPLWYNIASVCAYPSLYEGFGLPALEAMACGTPVIASKRSALPEVVGNAGVLVDPEDTDAWAMALGRILNDLAFASDLGRRGVERASQFSWERSASKTAEVLTRVIEGRGHR